MITTTRASGLAYEAISDYAERVGKHYDIYDANGRAELIPLIERLGGSVVVDDSPESLHVYGPGDFKIAIPYTTSTRRDRFTMAHELGHYFLHYLYHESTGPEPFGRGSRNRAETEANVFAASLLMPASKFKEWHARNDDDWFLAGIFDVSPAAAGVRSQALHLK